MVKNRFVVVVLWIFASLLLGACNVDAVSDAAVSETEDGLEETAVSPTTPHTVQTAESATQPAPATPTTVPTELPPTEPSIDLPDLGQAPEITNQVWLNTEGPISLASVQGEKAVLVEFWTFG